MIPAPDVPSAAATGLVLTGGGARAAYQVGVLQALARLRRAAGASSQAPPFPIITGTSAGAINAAALACGADDFEATVRRIARVWAGLGPERIYRSDALRVLRSDAPWARLLSAGWLIARWRRSGLRSLLDNSPLRRLLEDLVPLDRLGELMAQGHLDALAVTASSYGSGEHVTFYQASEKQQPWVRSRRLAAPVRIVHEHLLASSAIPFVFPATALEIGGHVEYFGDGSMRQSAPLAAAIHLGARRILAIGAGRMQEPADVLAPNALSGYPSLAQIAGHALSSIFLDALTADVERLRRINATLALIPAEARAATPLVPVELLLIAPSQRIDAIAARHVHALPPAVRSLLGEPAVSPAAAELKGSALASYLLFDAAFTRELMALGRADTLAQRDAVCAFFGWGVRAASPGA
ncbi:patatin-like phospholipase family protein [Variovorax sp. J22P271]|uniref:patatin-like phospholipase family protein n=1 Tax=Variovorax davisae TaxID=3053515 RepID=UPI00257757CE|nr:patatin-like phospholipase family protein [Variovorax sp. J22P271]MDM0031760.1 patatin-like phospholipase family protein [Variovorax sp. J22P271]